MIKRYIAVVPVVLLLASCGGTAPETEKKTEPVKKDSTPSEPIPAKTAFFEMYKPAYGWARDMQPLKMESGTLPGFKNEDGKAAVWRGTFGSPSRKEARTWTYAIAKNEPDIAMKGLSVGSALPWPGPTREVMPFTSSEFAIDSDAAYKSAMTQAGAWVKDHPDKSWTETLGNTTRFNGPVWKIMWGDNKSGYFLFIDAKTGQIIKK